jgi:hypothetical protein
MFYISIRSVRELEPIVARVVPPLERFQELPSELLCLVAVGLPVDLPFDCSVSGLLRTWPMDVRMAVRPKRSTSPALAKRL